MLAGGDQRPRRARASPAATAHESRAGYEAAKALGMPETPFAGTLATIDDNFRPSPSFPCGASGQSPPRPPLQTPAAAISSFLAERGPAETPSSRIHPCSLPSPPRPALQLLTPESFFLARRPPILIVCKPAGQALRAQVSIQAIYHARPRRTSAASHGLVNLAPLLLLAAGSRARLPLRPRPSRPPHRQSRLPRRWTAARPRTVALGSNRPPSVANPGTSAKSNLASPKRRLPSPCSPRPPCLPPPLPRRASRWKTRPSVQPLPMPQ